MTTLQESLLDSQALPIHDAVMAGADVLSGSQDIVFQPYIRQVLPIDGFVFWLNANLIAPEILASNGVPSADPITVNGSLHYASQGTQIEDESIVIRRVELTSPTFIEAFGAVQANVLYVGEYQTDIGSFRFAFSSRGAYYQQADIHHYIGDALYPAFTTQLLDTLDSFDQRQVVSNSLPIWLSIINGGPFPSDISVPGLTLYPAFLVPTNLEPPYGVVDIPANGTRALQSVPYRDINNSHWQLASDRVKFTFYGLRNEEVLDFQDYVYDFSLVTDIFGLMDMPIVRDDKRTQVEITALAMKKTLDMEISYYQVRMRELSRQLIQKVLITSSFSDRPVRKAPVYIVPPP